VSKRSKRRAPEKTKPNQPKRESESQHSEANPQRITGQVNVMPSHDNEGASQKKNAERREKIRFVVEIIGLITLVVYTVFAGLQSCSNGKSATAAKMAADVAKDSLTIGERPWVEIGTEVGIEHPNYAGGGSLTTVVPGIPIFRNFPFNFSVVSKNYGHNPALRVYIILADDWIELSGNPQPYLNNIEIPIDDRCRAESQFTESYHEAEFPNATYKYRTTQEIGRDIILEDWHNAKRAIVVHGCIRYKDSFNLDTSEFYQTDFCRYLWLAESTEWSPCAKGNSVR
jgi:hypothetical protein